MFLAASPVIKTAEVFTEMPAHFRRTGVHSEWANANRSGEAVDAFLEGPVFDRRGNLYVTDIIFGRVFCIDPKGQWSLVIEYDGEPNGMRFISDTELLITDYKNGLMRLNVDTAKLTPYLTRRNSERFKGMNDLVLDSQGNIYFTDQGQSGLHDPTGRVYRLRPSGQLDLLMDNIPSPNGIVLAPDEKALFVAVTRGNCVWRGPLMADGSIVKVGQFFTSYGPSGPDGLAMDQAGNLVVANPGLGYAWLINKRGEPLMVISSPRATMLTNIAFGGQDNKTLYCTESGSGSILIAQMPEPGMPLHRLPAN